MSRLGKKLISLAGKKIDIKIQNGRIEVKGPKGELFIPAIKGILIKIENDRLFVLRDEQVKVHNKDYGLARALINNMIIGVSVGFEKRLKLEGVGYRAQIEGNMLDLQIGRSHPTKLLIPEGVKVTVEKGVLIVVEGISKFLVGHFAAEIRAEKKPEPYKGKGIRYEKEHVRKKAGKAAKGKTG
ncbi:MAG: 50S ribosomal protein L6 [Chlamydiae bacterium]|nr:MAG: 50S ribosomal protein L6 [Chlamydiota bacterium]